MSKNMKILTTLSVTLFFSLIIFSVGVVYAGGVRGLGLVGLCLFLTFGVILVLAQLIPAGILFISMVATGFSSLRKGGVPAHASWHRKRETVK